MVHDEVNKMWLESFLSWVDDTLLIRQVVRTMSPSPENHT